MKWGEFLELLGLRNEPEWRPEQGPPQPAKPEQPDWNRCDDVPPGSLNSPSVDGLSANDWREWAKWAQQNPGLVYGWATTTWEGPPDVRDHQTSMHMIPLVPCWRVIELERAFATPPKPEQPAQRGEDEVTVFTEWLAREMPAGTVISDPRWWADRIVCRLTATGQADELHAEVERLNAIVNSPQSDDFLRAVSTESEHQRQRWAHDHDAGKGPQDWFWLIGYLAGKALHCAMYGFDEKAEHHVITTAAACANWHRAMKGQTASPEQPDVSTTTATLIDMLRQRDAQGLRKYAATLDRTDLTPAQWTQHAIEELLDAAGYLLALQRTRDDADALSPDGIAEVTDATSGACSDAENAEIQRAVAALDRAATTEGPTLPDLRWVDRGRWPRGRAMILQQAVRMQRGAEHWIEWRDVPMVTEGKPDAG